jgi:hypothetical protein
VKWRIFWVWLANVFGETFPKLWWLCIHVLKCIGFLNCDDYAFMIRNALESFMLDKYFMIWKCMKHVLCWNHASHSSEQVYTMKGKFPALHSLCMFCKITLAHTTGFTEWFITHSFLKYHDFRFRDRDSRGWCLRCCEVIVLNKMGCISFADMSSFWLYVVLFDLRICGLYFGCLVILGSLPSWSF